jgi:hypothetical protein
MYISNLKCGPGLLFIGLGWPSVQVEFEMPDIEYTYIRHLYECATKCSSFPKA